MNQRKARIRRMNYVKKRFLKGMRFFAVILGIAWIVCQIIFSGTRQTVRADDDCRVKYYKSIMIHTGDSLWSIADRYMTSEYDSKKEYIHEIRRINGFGGDELDQGSYLTIPYYN